MAGAVYAYAADATATGPHEHRANPDDHPAVVGQPDADVHSAVNNARYADWNQHYGNPFPAAEDDFLWAEGDGDLAEAIPI
jgi:hypothetical protein